LKEPLRLWWTHRWLLASFLSRELRSRYAGSLGGVAWVVVHPLIQLAIYTLVFQSVFRVSYPELERHPFIAFVALGLWPWLAFQEGLMRGTLAIKANAGLVRKVAFAHELLVVAAVAAAFLVHLTGLGLAALVLALFGVELFGSGLPMVLGLMGLLFLLTLAAALITASLQVFIPDVEQVLGPVLALGFYVTPVLYPYSAVPDWLKLAMATNPLLHFIEPMRQALLAGRPETLAIAPWLWAVTPLMLIPALWFFRRLSPYFEDFV
jgi:lipopolysaccharide transport system permease protein